ncbi:MAG: hypothetical protein Pars2KO_11220 [Parasphingorhabdus sp.]
MPQGKKIVRTLGGKRKAKITANTPPAKLNNAAPEMARLIPNFFPTLPAEKLVAMKMNEMQMNQSPYSVDVRPNTSIIRYGPDMTKENQMIE